MLDLKNSIWPLIQIKPLVTTWKLWIEKHVLHKSGIRIHHIAINVKIYKLKKKSYCTSEEEKTPHKYTCTCSIQQLTEWQQ